MSAAEWRRAMNTGASRHAWSRATTVRATATIAPARAPSAEARIAALIGHIRLRHILVLATVLVYPWVVNSFFTFQIGGQALALGLIALSLTFLGGYGGMVSLAQMSVAGVAGYMVAIFGVAGAAQGGASSLGWPWWLAVIIAVVIATAFATLVGWLSVRTEGIYTIMITLAIGVSFYYLAQQNYSVFGGHEGFNQVYAPTVLGIDFRQPIPYYYLALFWALAGYFSHQLPAARAVRHGAPRRARQPAPHECAPGFNVTAHRVAAYAVAGVLAAIGGVLMVWYNGRVSPGSGEHRNDAEHPHHRGDGRHEAPDRRFVGAIVFVLVQNFAIDIIARERFNLVIGAAFFCRSCCSRPTGCSGCGLLRARVLSGAHQSKIEKRRGTAPA